jgi:large subunit ribosomal protein L29
VRAKDLRERSTEDLLSLRETLGKDLFGFRMKNWVNRLDDTSQLRKTRKDIARIELLLHERGVRRDDNESGGET